MNLLTVLLSGVMLLKISEIFESLQGEGRYTGYPVLFIRLFGCNLNCSFCDTKFEEYKEYEMREVINIVVKYYHKSLIYELDPIIVITGGEPCIQMGKICFLIDYFKARKSQYNRLKFHIETNGTYLNKYLLKFDYICISPKSLSVAKRCDKFRKIYNKEKIDIKIVTDGEKIYEEFEFATMLMPLTTFDTRKDLEIKKRVWEICRKIKKIYTPRLHIDLYGKMRGV